MPDSIFGDSGPAPFSRFVSTEDDPFEDIGWSEDVDLSDHLIPPGLLQPSISPSLPWTDVLLADTSAALASNNVPAATENPRESHFLAEQLYRYYLIYDFGHGDSPNNPVELVDDGELQSAVASYTDRWYKQFADSHGPGFYSINENAAAEAPRYTGKSDYSGLGLLAHSGNVVVAGSVGVTIQRTALGYQKQVEFRVTWAWNDEIHGMTKSEWERRYPGQSGWKSPEVWLHWLADSYGAYYVRISWFDAQTYEGDIYGGDGAYDDAVQSATSKTPDGQGATQGAGPQPRSLPH